MQIFEKIFYMFVINFCILMLILILQIVHQQDLTASIRAVGVQCNVDYLIKLPKKIKHER